LKKIAVMGCPVNGPGEARDADLGIAGSRNGQVILFCSGQVRGTYGAEEGFEIFKSELLKNTFKKD
jgi:(E)-4-hydroxy-3-methylbut-2-enyl-diphosphate synthase